ncbi:MAG: hypothetical protein HDR88_13200 [Bacteroides sp.]|nr:hypothetical protein [Bacteroides sp.]
MQHITLPPANSLDYSDTDEVCAYQSLLCKLLEQGDGLMYAPKQSHEVRTLRTQGQDWLKKVEAVIAGILSDHRPDGISLADLPPLLSSYDFLYRVCNGTPCETYIRKVRLQATDRWAKGDRSISETDLVLMLLAEADRDIRSLDPRYSRYAVTMLGKWMDKITRFGSFPTLPSGELYRRLTYLLRANLFVYLGSRDQHRIKQQWVDTHLLTASQPQASKTIQLQNLTTPDLKSYLQFLLTASHLGYLPGTDPDTLYTSFCTLLATRPDLHPLHKEAIEIDLNLSPRELAS